MAVVDRIVLRLAVAELLDPDGPPPAVVIDEAVELAKEYSTDESGAVRQRRSWPPSTACGPPDRSPAALSRYVGSLTVKRVP